MTWEIREMEEKDWGRVQEIYRQGIETKIATFQSQVPEFEEWDKGHLQEGRLVAVDKENRVIGWLALSPTSSRCVYRGVVEVSIYIAPEARGQGIGTALLSKAVEVTEELGIWTLYSNIIAINKGSIALHKKCGFRTVGIRERIAKDLDGVWQDTVIMEKRSLTVGM